MVRLMQWQQWHGPCQGDSAVQGSSTACGAAGVAKARGKHVEPPHTHATGPDRWGLTQPGPPARHPPLPLRCALCACDSLGLKVQGADDDAPHCLLTGRPGQGLIVAAAEPGGKAGGRSCPTSCEHWICLPPSPFLEGRSEGPHSARLSAHLPHWRFRVGLG